MANSATHAALPYPIRGARFTIAVPYLDADGDPTDPTTPDTEVSKDGAAFADCTEEVSTITGSNGAGFITLTGAETDCAMLVVAAKVASGPKATLLTAYPRQLVSIGTGTLAAGSAGGGTLGTILPYDLAGCFIRTTGGTGGGGTGGANNQARKIMTYIPATGAFTVTPEWETTPSTDTTYELLLPEGVTLGMLRVIAESASGTLSGTHSSTTADLGTNAPSVDIAGQTLYFPEHKLARFVDSYNTGTGVATFSPAVGVTLANGDAWQLIPSPPASTGAPPAVNVSQWAGSAVATPSVAGVPEVDVTHVAGSVQASIATQASVDTIDDFLDTEVAAILALLDDPRSEPGQGAPPVNPDLATKIDYLYKAWRNRSTVSATQYSLYADDGTTIDQKAALSDDGTTFTRAELATGP